VRIAIRHRTAYQFDRPVFLEPHVIRLRPRADAAVHLLSAALTIDPAPAVRSDSLDFEGNVVTQAWFDGTVDHLAVESRATVDTGLADPFQFLLDHPKRTLPDPYPVEIGTRLAAYRSAPDTVAPAVRAFAARVAEGVDHRPDRFPAALAARIHGVCLVEIRDVGAPHPAEITLDAARGACRDLAVLFIDCCHAVGLAARFVSGYAHVDGTTGHELGTAAKWPTRCAAPRSTTRAGGRAGSGRR
jgi:transglutaminase-like putative cysteine protease